MLQSKYFELVVRRGVAALTVMAVTACSTQTRSLSEQQQQALKVIDVIVAVPPTNFAGRPDSGGIFVSAPAGVAASSVIGINIVANLLIAGISHAASATLREAAGPVGATVKDIDLRVTVFNQLRALLPPEQASRLRLSERPFPKLKEERFEKTLAATAAQTQSDATLFIVIAPLVSPIRRLHATTESSAVLVARTGEQLLTIDTMFVGPYSPELERPELISWWADGRYRQAVLEGVRATMLPLAARMAPDENVKATLGRLQAKLNRLPVVTLTEESFRSSSCPFAAGARPETIYRFEWTRHRLLVAAACAGDEEAKTPAGADADLHWTARMSPSLLPAATLVAPR